MNNLRITQNGKPLDESLYTIDMENMVFSSGEDNLVLDFTGLDGWTFKTGNDCIFTTSYGCTFDTGSDCTFKTGSHCTFNTGSDCTFKTSYNCTFKTSYNCTFKTGDDCTFDTGECCIFSLYNIDTCKFKIGDGYSTILDRTDKKHYLLTKEFVKLQKVVNG